MIQTIKMNLDDEKKLSQIAKALSIETRIDILKQLRHRDLNINEIAEILSIPASSAAAHIKVLEEAGFIRTELQPAVRGSMKVCHAVLDHIYVELNTSSNIGQETKIIRMPVGCYVDCKVSPTCGIAGVKGPIGEEDNPKSFYSTERFEAKLIWLRDGYVEYRFPNDILEGKKVKQLELSAELCSEDHEYNLDCPSEITLWINEKEVGTWICPSDFGGRRGSLNPDWWPDKNTQYGILKRWMINESGSYLDEKQISEKTIETYSLLEKNYISVKIGMKENAVYKGGVNIFGDCFGDYNQDIIMKLSFVK